MRDTLRRVAKWGWIGGVLIAAGFILSRSWDDIVGTLQATSPWLLALALLLTVGAKLFLAENARLGAARAGIPLPWSVAARLYNVSQLGKYLPGSIWQYVGRAAAYRDRGASYADIRDALLIESLWIAIGAASVGFLLGGPVAATVVWSSMAEPVRIWLGVGIVLGGLACAAAAVFRRELLFRYLRKAHPSWRVIAVQLAIWALLGLAFWVLARACGVQAGAFFCIGLFSAAYAIGFVVPIAPAGLGIRDAVLTIGLLPFAATGEALVVTILARAVYLLVDVALVVLQEPLFSLAEARAARNES